MAERVEPILERVESLYDVGRYLDAYDACRSLGPLGSWQGEQARIIAGRLAHQLGSSRLGNALHWLAGREYPDSPRVIYFYCRTVLQQRGPCFTLQMMSRWGDLDQAEPGHQSEWLSLRGYLYALLRDFEQADRDVTLAEAISPGRRWLSIDRASILELEDRYDEALAVAQGVFEREPDYRPAVMSVAHLLEIAGKRDEAVALLEAAGQKMQSGMIHTALGGLFREQNRYDEARAQFEKAAELFPLLEAKVGDAWMARVRSDLACACGDYQTGLELLRSIEDRDKLYFHKQVQQSLAERKPDAKRKLLDVAFIRQHYRTCAPATLAMIAAYWGRPAEHLEIADAICYDGTPYHAERNWAEQQGYLTREFTVTPAIAEALIDRGIPFTFSTTEATSAHLQAVIGYDQARQVLLLRDPFYPSTGEILCRSLAEAYGAYGPRGMILVPADRAELLDGLDLPDTGLWDLYHQVQGLLQDHQRDQAMSRVEQAIAQAPEHTLTLNIRLSLANYDRDSPTRAELIDTLAERYPKCQGLQLRKLDCLSEQGLRDQRLAMLKELSEREDVDLVFLQRYADELSQDAREARRARSLLRRVIRRSYRSADAYVSLADLLWGQRRFDEARPLYRFSACLEERREYYALNWFRCERYFRAQDQAMAFLENRFERQGDKDAGPARTLYEAYRMTGRPDLGLATLDTAMQRRPEDVNLAIFAATELSRYGRAEQARGLLDRLEGRCDPLAWHNAAATLADHAADYPAAIEHLREVTRRTPLDVGAHVQLSNLLRHTQGPEPAHDHLRRMVERFPHHVGMITALYESLSGDEPGQALATLRTICERNPNNAWAWRELGYLRVEEPDGLAEAEQCAEQAMQIEPGVSATLGLVGRTHLVAGRDDLAQQVFRAAVETSCDYTYAVEQLVELQPTRERRRAALSFIFDQLRKQPVLGDGVLCYQSVARQELEPAELLEHLEEARAARPDLWPCWGASIDQLMQMDDLDRARDLALESTQRFPLNAGLWARLAEVYRLRLEPEQQIQALRQDLALAPDHSYAVYQLILALEHAGRLDEAEQTIDDALARSPRDAALHARAADLYWMTDRPERALASIRHALELQPHFDRAWSRFAEWAGRLGREDQVAALARQVAEQRPGEYSAWLTLAYNLDGGEHLSERLAALDRASQLRPREIEAHDLRATVLAEAMRFDEALAACKPAVFNGEVPFNLRGRAAWVLDLMGRTREAADAMRQVLDDNPGYEWGYRNLADWCERIGDYEGQMDAADQLIRINPGSVLALGYRAHCGLTALRRGGSSRSRDELRRQVEADLTRSIQLDPTYQFACGELLELLFEDGRCDQAEQIIERCGPFMPPEERLARQVALAAARKDKARARDLLAQLCLAQYDDAWPIGYACRHARDMGIVPSVLREAVNKPEVNPRIARELLRPSIERKDWMKAASALKSLRDKPDCWDHAAGFFMDQAGQFGASASFITSHYRRNRQRYQKSNIETWGCAAYALSCAAANKQLKDHFQGWEQRDGVKPWMLSNYIDVFLIENRLDEGRDLLHRVLQMPPDHSYTRHLIDLAHCEACTGDAEQAQQLLDASAPDALPPGYQFNHAATCAIVAARACQPAAADRHLLAARQAESGWKKNRSSVKTYRRAARVVGRHAGFGGKLVMLWRLMDSAIQWS